jgi:DNA-binding transcriptional regulator YdaS (Cro superfamily)
MKTLKQAVDEISLKVAADLLAITPQRLSNWMERGVPVELCAVVDSKLGVSRKVLRPDDWFLIWPEMDGAQAIVDAQQIQPQAPTSQALAATENVAVEVA